MKRYLGGNSSGFSLIELVAVMVIVSVLATVAVVRIMPSAVHEIQAAKDQLASALAYAQQRALYTPHTVRVILSGNQIDIREDLNDDSSYSEAERIRHGAVQYPLTLVNQVQVSSHILDYDNLGEIPAPVSVTLSKGSRSVTLSISLSGYAR